MIPLSLEVVEPLGRLIARPWAVEVTGLQVDSRRIEEGDLFVAVGGGRDFVEHALARGAGAALVPDDHAEALAAIAGAVRRLSKAQVVAITGSTGKTSTKDILFAICAPSLRTIANEGNFNNEIGVPLTLCRLEAETELLIAEMGMRGLGQIAWLASFTDPDIAVITNIGPVHLELVETIENVAQAKAELIAALRPGGVAVVPAGEPLLEPYLTRDDITVERVRSESALPFTASFGARHQLANARTAVAVAQQVGVPLPSELTVEFSELRDEERPLAGGGLLLNDCYNANPVSMRAALEHLVERGRGRRRIAVLGQMAELGRDADGYHREIGALVHRLGIERVIGVGEHAQAYGGDWVPSAAEAAVLLQDELRPGDVVLVKGSRSVGLETVAENLVA